MIPVWPVGPRTNAEPRGGCERRATGVPMDGVKRGGRGKRGRMAGLLAVGLAVAALLTAGPAHAQGPIVPDLSEMGFDFFWYTSITGGPNALRAQGHLSINRPVDVYSGKFAGYLLPPNYLGEAGGVVTGQMFPPVSFQGVPYYPVTFTVSSPVGLPDLWTYTGYLHTATIITGPTWAGSGRYLHTDPRDPDFYDEGSWLVWQSP
jgi:hypothetical protein